MHLDAGKGCIACNGDGAKLDRMAEVTRATTMFSCLNVRAKNQAKRTVTLGWWLNLSHYQRLPPMTPGPAPVTGVTGRVLWGTVQR